MSKYLQPITSCLKKAENKEENDGTSRDKTVDNDKKADAGPVSQPNMLWRVSSQLFNIGSGAVGVGVGSVKWAASTTYTVGTGVISTAQTVVSKVVPSAVPKPKKE